MPIEIGGIGLSRVHKITTLEFADFASHRIPGLDGNVVQNMGRHSVQLQIEGIFYGDEAQDQLESLRDIYKAREPVDFLTEIIGQAYFSLVIIEKIIVNQSARLPEQFSYKLIVSEYVPPPEPSAGFGLPDTELDLEIELGIELEALDFMDMIQIPDLLSVPNFGDPTVPLEGILGEVGEVFNVFQPDAESLNGLFQNGSGQRMLSRNAAASSPSIFGELDANLDDSALLSLITDQIGSLVNADGVLANILDNAPQGIDNLANWFGDLSIPELDQANILSEGISGLEELIPIDTSAIVGNLTNTLEDFFGGLNLGIVDELTNIVQTFQSIAELSSNLLGNEEDSPDGEIPIVNTSDLTPASRGVSRGPGGSTDNEVIQALEEIKAVLAELPDPLTAASLLEWLLERLKGIPRSVFPFQYLPVYDELTDKLETTLGWLNMDGNQLSESISASIDKLRDYLLEEFLQKNIGQVTDTIDELNSSIDATQLSDTIDTITQGLNSLVQSTNSGNLNGTMLTINQTLAATEQLQQSINVLNDQIFNGQKDQLNTDLSKLGDTTQDSMIRLIAILSPPSELAVINLISLPFNQLLDEIGVSSLSDRISELFSSITELFDRLNLTAIKDTLQDVVDGAIGGVDELKQKLVEATIDFSLMINQLETAINDLGIDALKAAFEDALNSFEQLVGEGVEAIFGPVREVLMETFCTILEIVQNFDPQVIFDTLRELLQTITDIFNNPQLLDLIDQIKAALDKVNGSLGDIAIQSVTGAVIDAINVVKDALKIAGSIPLSDALLDDLTKAIKDFLPQPPVLRSTTDSILDTLEDVIEDGPAHLLQEIKDKPAELVEFVQGYSPDQYLGNNISQAYQEFLSKLEEVKLAELLTPLTDALDDVKSQVLEVMDPEKLFNPLDPPFDKVLELLGQFDLNTIIDPINEILQEGIQAVTENIPLDATDVVFEQIDEIAKNVNEALEVVRCIRDLIDDTNTRFNGLNDAENQIITLGDTITGKLDEIGDFAPLTAAFTALEEAIDATQAAPIIQRIETPIDSLVDKLTQLDPKNQLVAMVAAQRAIARPQVDALPDSPEKTALIALLDSFDPIDNSISNPLDGLEDWKEELLAHKAALTTFFSDWDTKFHATESPLNELRASGLSLNEFKALLSDSIREQLTQVLAPFFKAVDYFREVLGAALGEISNLIAEVEQTIADFLGITEAFEGLRTALDNLIEVLNTLDITFIATEIEALFTAVKDNLESIRPSVIGAELKATFENLLALLDINNLLGIDAIDQKYQELIDLLQARDPGVLLTNLLQPEFDKVIVFLEKFDFSESIEVFLNHLDGLQAELDEELNKVIDAYEGMFDTIPSDIQAELNVSASI